MEWNFVNRLEKSVHKTTRRSPRRRRGEGRRLRRMIFMTMTHRLCIRAGPSTLEAGRVTTLVTTLLPTLHAGRRFSRSRDALFATGRTSRAWGNDLSLFPLRRHPRRRRLSEKSPPAAFGDREAPGIARLTGVLSERWPVAADGRARRGPHEFSPLRAPHAPHRRVCQVCNGVNSLLDFRSTIIQSADYPFCISFFYTFWSLVFRYLFAHFTRAKCIRLTRNNFRRVRI